MPEIASLAMITRDALRLAYERRSLWWFAFPASLCIGIGSLASQKLQSTLPTETADAALWISLFTNQSWLIAVGLVFVATFGQSIIRGPLLILLNRKPTIKHDLSQTITWLKAIRAIYIAITFELTYWLFLIGTAALVCLPSLLAWHFNPSVLPVLIELGLLLLLTLAIYLHFIKELSLFYALLGKVRFTTAVDLGFRLFQRQTFTIVLFFFYAALLALFFGLLFEAAKKILGLSLSDLNRMAYFFTFIPLGGYFIFDQTLRLFFFRAVATPPKKPLTKKVALETSESSSSITPS